MGNYYKLYKQNDIFVVALYQNDKIKMCLFCDCYECDKVQEQLYNNNYVQVL